MNRVKYIISSVTLLALPVLVSAQGDFENLGGAIGSIIDFLESLIPLAIGLAVVIFLFGIIKYMTAGADEEGRKNARNMIIYGIIFLFVMVSVWGLVNVLVGTFGLESGFEGELPDIPTN